MAPNPVQRPISAPFISSVAVYTTNATHPLPLFMEELIRHHSISRGSGTRSASSGTPRVSKDQVRYVG